MWLLLDLSDKSDLSIYNIISYEMRWINRGDIGQCINSNISIGVRVSIGVYAKVRQMDIYINMDIRYKI